MESQNDAVFSDRGPGAGRLWIFGIGVIDGN